MQDHYVLSGRWFDQSVDVLGALEAEGYDILDPEDAVYADKEVDPEKKAIFVEGDWGGVVCFHNSWGDSLRSCTKLKAYVWTTQTAFMDDDEVHEWEDEMGHKINDWLIENTGAEPLPDVDSVSD